MNQDNNKIRYKIYFLLNVKNNIYILKLNIYYHLCVDIFNTLYTHDLKTILKTIIQVTIILFLYY